VESIPYRVSEKLPYPHGIPAIAVLFHYGFLQRAQYQLIKGVFDNISIIDVQTLKISRYSRSPLIFRPFSQTTRKPYFQTRTSIPPVISKAAIIILGVNGSFRKRQDSRIVNTILPLSITLTSDTLPNCNAR